MDCLLGIDIGTTGTKSALFSSDGELIDSDYKTYPILYPGKGMAEQDPEDWWDALVTTVRNISSQSSKIKDVAAMSLSTQGGCLVLLDDNFKPLCHAVSWLDRRASETSELLEKQMTAMELYRTCGWGSINALMFPLTFWFRQNRPDIFKKARYFASTVDYINFRLTGTFSTDYTNLALAEFLDIDRKDWSDRALDVAGISRESISEIRPSGTVIGRLKSKTASILGLPEHVVLVSGAHDQYCANIGAGAVNTGDCVLSTGTAWVLTLTADRLLFDDEFIIHPCLHILDNKYGLMTAVASGGNSLNWFRNTFRPDMSYKDLSAEAEKAEPGSNGLLFVPQNISKSGKGSFQNIDTVHGFAHFTRSVFEGVVLSNRLCLDSFSKYGVSISRVIMIGGGAKSSVWPQITADVSGIPIVINEQTEAACAGAALLAGAGVGMYPSIEKASKRFTGKQYVIEPDEENAAIYDGVYREFLHYLGK